MFPPDKDVVIRRSISRDIFQRIFFTSLLVTFLFTSIGSYIAYKQELDSINARIVEIEKTQAEIIAVAIWEFDEKVLSALVKGILHYPYICHVEIKNNNNVRVLAEGRRAEKGVINKHIPLYYKSGSEQINLGTLFLQADTSGMIGSVAIGAIIRLLIVAAIVVIISMAISIIFKRRMLSYVIDMVDYLRNDSTEDFANRLSINKKDVGDEIDLLVNSFNAMKDNLQSTFEEKTVALIALTESEKRFRILIEQAPEAIVLFDVDQGRLTDANPAAERLFGYSREELLQSDLTRFYTEEPDGQSLAESMADYNKRVLAGETLTIRRRLHAFDGKSRLCEVHLVGLQSEQGNLIRGTFIDITDQVESQYRIAELVKRLQLATSSAALGVWDWNVKDNVMSWDDRMFELYGVPRETFQKCIEAWTNGLHPEDKERAIEECNAALRGEKEFDTEFRVLHPDGKMIWLKATALVVRDESGNAARMLGLNQDITERKRVENELRKSEEKHRMTIHTAIDGFWRTDTEGRLIEVNEAYCRMSGYSEKELLAMNIIDFEVKETRHDTMARMKKIMSEGQDRFETCHRRKDGSIIDLDIVVQFKQVEGGQIVVFLRDITERKTMEQEKQSLYERVQRSEKMEALGLLAGGVAHDLNNSLGILVGYAEFLYDDLDETDPRKEDARNIVQGGEQAAAIVQDLLTLARRGVQTKAPANLNKVVTEYLKSPEYLKLKSFHPEVHVKTELEEDLLQIKGSKAHLSKTLMNLVSNAAESMPMGGEIIIHTENCYLDRAVSGYDELKEGDYVILSVSDEGEGITDDDMKRIFEPFYTKKVMGRSGTGLGLSVVWGTVKDHEGYIDVKRRRDKGTTFTLYFPVTREEIAVVPTSIPLSDYIGNDESILVIDDIKEQRELAAKMLGKLNYKVKTVSSGEEAVQHLRTEKADLLVLDMIMDPGMDGLDTYRAILEIHPNQKAIIVSGFSETDRVKEAKTLGAGDYIRKPYVIERLGLGVRKELDRT